MIHKIYIGSNNATKELERDKILRTVGYFFEGFTMYEAQGFWKGVSEKTAILEIETPDSERIKTMVNHLKDELKQEAICYSQLPSLQFI